MIGQVIVSETSPIIIIQKHESLFLALTKCLASQGGSPRPQLAQYSWMHSFTTFPYHHWKLPQWPWEGGKGLEVLILLQDGRNMCHFCPQSIDQNQSYDPAQWQRVQGSINLLCAQKERRIRLIGQNWKCLPQLETPVYVSEVMNLYKVMDHDNPEENRYDFGTPSCFVSETDLFFTRGSAGQGMGIGMQSFLWFPAFQQCLVHWHGRCHAKEEGIRDNGTKIPPYGSLEVVRR